MSYYLDIFRGLQAHKVRYLVVGGLAVNLHGVPRVTHDLDIIISLDKENVTSLVKALAEVGFIPRLPVNPIDISNPNILNEWITEKHMKAFSFFDSKKGFHIIDIVVLSPISFEEAHKRKETKRINEVVIDLVSIDDLIRMKRMAGRQIDQSDIVLLDRLKRFLEETK